MCENSRIIPCWNSFFILHQHSSVVSNFKLLLRVSFSAANFSVYLPEFKKIIYWNPNREVYSENLENTDWYHNKEAVF